MRDPRCETVPRELSGERRCPVAGKAQHLIENSHCVAVDRDDVGAYEDCSNMNRSTIWSVWRRFNCCGATDSADIRKHGR